MLLAYVDESYSEDWYYMAALMVRGRQAVTLTNALDQVVAKAAVDHAVDDRAELHGHEVFQGRGAWSALPPRARIGVYNGAFQAMAECRVKVILRGLRRVGLMNQDRLPEKPHVIVLRHLLERINEHVTHRNTYALVIADEVDEPAKHRADLSAYRSQGTKGDRSQLLDRIVDTLHFVPSHSSRLVQAADLLAFMYRRVETHTESDPRATRANEALWSRIQPIVQHRHCWIPGGREKHKGPARARPEAGSEAQKDSPTS